MSTADIGSGQIATIEGGYSWSDPMPVVQKNEQNEREQKSIVFC